MDRGAWWATVYGVAKSRTQLSDQHTHILPGALIKSKEIALYSHQKQGDRPLFTYSPVAKATFEAEI